MKRQFHTHCAGCRMPRAEWPRQYGRPGWASAAYCSRDCKARSEALRNAVYVKVTGAIALGLLASPKTLPCKDCGVPATCYDHRDYSKPLEVDAVCHGCNVRRGPALHPMRLAA